MLTKQAQRLFILALLTVLIAVPASSQEDDLNFGEVIDVKVINVEIVVTDRSGERVHGLGPGDFILRVDGQEVPVEYFTEVIAGSAAALQEGSPRNGHSVPRLAPGEAVGTNYLVFIDEVFAIEKDRDMVIDRVALQIDRLGPADRMAIVAYNGGLELLTSWTNEAGTLHRALDLARERPARGIAYQATRLDLDDLGFYDGIAGSDFFYSTRSFYQTSNRFAGQLERLVSAATATLRSFAQPPRPQSHDDARRPLAHRSVPALRQQLRLRIRRHHHHATADRNRQPARLHRVSGGGDAVAGQRSRRPAGPRPFRRSRFVR
ncbi:MAG: hypothetical protein AAGD38_04470 [Acidobacteriota bacterium]